MRRVSFDLLDFYRRRLTFYGVDTRALNTVSSAGILEQLLDGFEAAPFASANEARAVHSVSLLTAQVFCFRRRLAFFQAQSDTLQSSFPAHSRLPGQDNLAPSSAASA